MAVLHLSLVLLQAIALYSNSLPGCLYVGALQEIQLDSKVKLLDCPGVIFDDETHSSSSSLLLRNVVRVESMEEPEVRADHAHSCIAAAESFFN